MTTTWHSTTWEEPIEDDFVGNVSAEEDFEDVVEEEEDESVHRPPRAQATQALDVHVFTLVSPPSTAINARLRQGKGLKRQFVIYESESKEKKQSIKMLTNRQKTIHTTLEAIWNHISLRCQYKFVRLSEYEIFTRTFLIARCMTFHKKVTTNLDHICA